MTTWTTKDGRRLKIQEMTDQHLINTIRYVERNQYKYVMCFGGGSGEDVWYEEKEIDLMPQYLDMRREAYRRGLRL